jgi:hypothetical protein
MIGHMKNIMPLYTPLACNKKHAVVYEKAFQNNQLRIGLRPLWLPNDGSMLNSWLFDEFAKGIIPMSHLPENHLQETFSAMLQCDFAQPFMGLVNSNPGFLIEIYDGDRQLNEMEESAHIFEKGDHSIRLIMSPAVITMQVLGEYALMSSLDYFFSYLQVNRIVWELNEKDMHYIYLANRLGFSVYRAHDWPGIQVYLFSRENFTRFSGTHH